MCPHTEMREFFYQTIYGRELPLDEDRVLVLDADGPFPAEDWSVDPAS